FLGLDNIGVFDRSAPLPTGGHLEQADGTAWMALFCQNMFEMALEMVDDDESSGYRDLAVKFCRHFFYIAAAMNRMGVHEDEMWDEEDGFFYDLLRLPDGRCQRLKVRSMVGLLPMCAVSVIELDVLRRVPELGERLSKKIGRDSPLLANIADPTRPGERKSRLLSILNEPNLRRVLARLFDPDEFLSDYGIRSLSRYHARHPYVFHWRGQDHRVSYLPAESDTGMFGGNSNWRGPIWIPVNTLIVRALLQYYSYYGDSFKVEFPTGSGRQVTLYEAAREIVTRLTSIFLRNQAGKRPVYGGTEKFQNDPHWRDLILFYEYFHGDCGAGLGASHQTGWTGVVAALESYFSLATPETVLKKGSRMLAGSGKRK
ncbi:glucosidase, partial [bacterium CPR1]|nr:glucosidase [bacterium CPR1]